MKHFWLVWLLRLTFVFSEVVEVPNLALYHATPKNEDHMRYLNKLRTSDSGMLFIHGVGAIGETVEILTSPKAMEIYAKDLSDMKLHVDMEFNPVTIQFNNDNATVKKETAPSVADAMKAAAAIEKTNDEFLPIEPIAKPNVFSGIFLKIAAASKEMEVDVLSYGGIMNSTMGNPYVCLAVKKGIDESAASKQWIFEKTEKAGYYVLRNRKLCNGYVTWEDDEEQYLVIETRREFQRLYRKEGPLRKNVLFKVTKDKKNPNAYQLAVKGMDNDDTHIIIDPQWKESTGCYLLKRSFREANFDGDKLETTFAIEKAKTSLKIQGLIENFKYPEKVDDLYQRSKEHRLTKALTNRHVFNHSPYPFKIAIEDAHERRDKFHIKFEDSSSMNVFNDLLVPAGLNIGSTMSLNGTDKPTMIKLDMGGKDTIEKFKYHISGSLQVPAWSSVQYTVMFGWLEKFSMNFEATMRMVGRGDRMTFSDKPKVMPEQLLSAEYVAEALKQRGFKMPIGKNPTMPVKGTIFARTMGIKGDVEMTVKKLSNKILTACHHNN